MTNKNLDQYYSQQAAAYDRIYDRPERQAELQHLHQRVAEILRGHKVLEIACGTGYWTKTIASTAASVHATDINSDMLNLARARGLEGVSFAETNAYDLPDAPGQYTAVFAGFLWAHVKREEQERFLQHLRTKLGKDTLLVLLDNVYVDGASTVIARTDAEGNTYQIRTADSGERFEVIKNFPADSFLRKRLGNAVREIRIDRRDYYWLLTCRLK